MNRTIICQACQRKLNPIYPEDAAMGFKRRVVEIVAQKPPELTRTLLAGKTMKELKVEMVENLDTIMCDRCGKPIPDGTPCAAVSMWRGPEPGCWETEYNKPITS